jgi:hypothetical protein
MNTQWYKYTERLRYADRLIRMEGTGNPKEFADKLHISESHLYVLLEEMKLMGLPVAYNKTKSTYVYTQPVQLHIRIEIKEST